MTGIIESKQEIVLKGVAISRGIAIGKPFVIALSEDKVPEFTVAPEHIETEIQRYRQAIQQTRKEIQYLQRQLTHAHLLEGADILEAQLEIMQDSLFVSHVEQEIQRTRKNAEAAFQSVLEAYQEKFQALPTAFFRERFADVQDIARRILGHLKASTRISLTSLPPESIIFSRELSASETAEANLTHAIAFVTTFGGINSHASIVAKSRGTPYVSNISFEGINLQQHTLAIVDGRSGVVILSPSANTLAHYQLMYHELRNHLKKMEGIHTLGVETFDGYPICLSANIEKASELEMLHRHGGHGVGLFRSEYIILAKARFPTEEEQFEIYKDLAEKMQGSPIVIRTFDVGGDKCFADQSINQEINPYLGCRAIRFLLKEREIFAAQLRAILRAGQYGDVRLMFPMVSTLSELREAKQAVEEAKEALRRRGERVPEIRIGCMVEVPSAAVIADLLAKECDFLSIGTNDLIQYTLAVDRSNHALNSLYTPTHPSVLRLIRSVVQEAHRHQIPVTVCGEVAADPRFIPLLLGLGVHELSVATRYIPIIKHAVRHTSIVSASQLAEKALTLATAEEIQELLSKEYKQIVPDDCFYND